jgi:hypothetical protein
MPSPIRDRARLSTSQGVACATASACQAVGLTYLRRARGEVFSLSGDTWSVAHRVRPSSSLQDVSCPIPGSCVAVGDIGWSRRTGLAAHKTGSRWSLVKTPVVAKAASSFSGVSCSLPTSCHAVGYWFSRPGGPYHPVAASWNGTSWSRTL